ncbi:MAG: DUF933 domain-containing protein [Candidatus Sumerlaeia bacterium]|nr:DUF933 domain-containing protein [Candidatus Sumerlaeia bacterium]
MELGIIGLWHSGKTTIFNVLSAGRSETLPATRPGWHSQLATIKINDPRALELSSKFKPAKTTLATATIIDVVGPPPSAHTTVEKAKKSPLEAQLQHLASADALIVVIRAFNTPELPSPDIYKDVENILLELILSDMNKIEHRLPGLEKSLQKVSGKEKEHLILEQTVLKKALPILEAQHPLSELTLAGEEDKLIRGFQFVSRKPLLFIINTDAEDLTSTQAQCSELKKRFPFPEMEFIVINAEIEKEIMELKPEERVEFMKDYQITIPAGERIISKAMKLLQLISFYTINPNELRVWLIKQGTTAFEAAGMVHTDFQRGFIRAEVIGWEQLIHTDGFANARRAGILRSEGKAYTIQDGEVINFLFNL